MGGRVTSVLIAHHREDTSAYAREVSASLRTWFGEDAASFGVSALLDGEDFTEAVDRAVRSCDVVLVLIGSDWLSRVVDDRDDRVRYYVASALRYGVTTVPVIVEGAATPDLENLPSEIAPLARIPTVPLRRSEWKSDLARLLRLVEDIIGDRASTVATAKPSEGAKPGREGVTAGMIRPPAPTSPYPGREPLDTLLVTAARAGVVPASHRPERSGPMTMTRTYEEFEREAGQRVASRGPWAPLPEPVASRRPSTPLRVLAYALPLAGLAAATKWLFGWFALPTLDRAVDADLVDCTVFAPPSVSLGESVLIQVFAHLAKDADDARAIATELDPGTRRRAFRSLESPIRHGSRMSFELRIPGIEIADPVDSLIWRGRAEPVQFGVDIPVDLDRGALLGTVEVSVDAAPLGRVVFKLAVGESAPTEPVGNQARRYTAAFVSYASADRAKVLPRVQLLNAVGIRYFQDVLDLDPGDRWKRELYRQIDSCDLFLLFWSREAKGSEWVRREVRYALARADRDEHALPAIRPVIIEGPPIVEPWEELADLHFNDRILYFMAAPEAS